MSKMRDVIPLEIGLRLLTKIGVKTKIIHELIHGCFSFFLSYKTILAKYP